MTEKLKLQQEIRENFSDWQIEAKRQTLCCICQSFDYGHCQHGLLPVTSDGSDCPYFEKRRDSNGNV